MLAANERLTGRTFVYDGNPHEFGDPAQSAQASAAAAPPARDEDQVGHLNQRGAAAPAAAAAGNNNRKPVKGAAGGGRKAAAAGDAQGGPGKGRSRSRGKDKGRATAKPKSNAAAAAGTGTDATTSGGGGASAATSASVRSAVTAAGSGCCSEKVVPSSLCTEGVGGAPALSLWNAPAAAAGAPSNGRAGVFGDFKFDMRDILSAVPQG